MKHVVMSFYLLDDLLAYEKISFFYSYTFGMAVIHC